jgi:DNA adenine methylase
LANWIHSLEPEGYTHRNIVFGGGLGEFWNWRCEGVSEAVNDANGELTNFYRVLAQTPDRMLRQLWGTPFSQDVWTNAVHDPPEADLLRRATRFFIKIRQSRQGLGKDFATPTRRTRRGMNENVSAWLSAVDGLPAVHERLRRVEIRNLDFAQFIQKYDHEKALFYCDPPYLHATRSTTGEYGPQEMTEDQHLSLINRLAGIKGKFMLSGYPSKLYEHAEWVYKWKRHEKRVDNHASSAKIKERKTECIWCNYE